MTEIGFSSKEERDKLAKSFFAIISTRTPDDVYANEKKGLPPVLALGKPEELTLLKTLNREIEEEKKRGKMKIENDLLKNMNHDEITPHTIEYEKELMGFAKIQVVELYNSLQRLSDERKREKEREVDEYQVLKDNPYDI